MLRKLFLTAATLGILFFGLRALVHALASDETKIRWALEDACEGFSEERVGPVLAVLADDYVDETTGFHRDDVHAAVSSLFFTAKDPKTKDFPYRAELVPDALHVAVENERATVKMRARLVDTRAQAEHTSWEFELEGRMEERDGDWRWITTTHRTLAGDWKMR